MHKWASITPQPCCACGCGEPVTRISNGRRWHRFVFGHAVRLQPTGEGAYRWKGGEVRHDGYVHVYAPGHPRAVGVYVRRSLLVAEQKIGRPMKPGEVVHHKNQQRDDDRPENIEVLESQASHVAHHNRRIHRAKKLTAERVRELKRLMTLPHPKPKWRERDPLSDKRLAERFGTTMSTIRSIRKGEYWRWVSHDDAPHRPDIEPARAPAECEPDRHR